MCEKLVRFEREVVAYWNQYEKAGYYNSDEAMRLEIAKTYQEYPDYKGRLYGEKSYPQNGQPKRYK